MNTSISYLKQRTSTPLRSASYEIPTPLFPRLVYSSANPRIQRSTAQSQAQLCNTRGKLPRVESRTGGVTWLEPSNLLTSFCSAVRPAAGR
jgi:hypothetical protein